MNAWISVPDGRPNWTRAAELWFGKPHLRTPGALCEPLSSNYSMHLRVPAHCMEAERMQRRGSYVRVSTSEDQES